jgi:drug/metabolite transporter (DMT)-like permease
MVIYLKIFLAETINRSLVVGAALVLTGVILTNRFRID